MRNHLADVAKRRALFCFSVRKSSPYEGGKKNIHVRTSVNGKSVNPAKYWKYGKTCKDEKMKRCAPAKKLNRNPWNPTNPILYVSHRSFIRSFELSLVTRRFFPVWCVLILHQLAHRALVLFLFMDCVAIFLLNCYVFMKYPRKEKRSPGFGML